ncbi:MEKHLA domain-containing protein [Pantanalinema sp. GBBB05]|uniref:MEKHLA domain-containing protein n=1 Tax=Pantanalinema sp. GBBB05 TaxID=2604139 RepID=UPI001D512E58|nr:MEKHLA domain-containing protein [Pantanalinema sp. GBBB05]
MSVSDRPEPFTQLPWQDPIVIQHSQRLLRSFQHWTGRPLLVVDGSPIAIAEPLFTAPFVLVSHGTEVDPILNYGNQQALQLWEMDWQQLTQTPSRLTAEPISQETRNHLLAQVQTQGYVSGYEGIRISSTGRRFRISNVVVWDVLDENNDRCGQAATFDRWEFI